MKESKLLDISWDKLTQGTRTQHQLDNLPCLIGWNYELYINELYRHSGLLLQFTILWLNHVAKLLCSCVCCGHGNACSSSGYRPLKHGLDVEGFCCLDGLFGLLVVVAVPEGFLLLISYCSLCHIVKKEGVECTRACTSLQPFSSTCPIWDIYAHTCEWLSYLLSADCYSKIHAINVSLA